MKTDTIFKRAYNLALDHILALAIGDALPSENQFRSQLQVSRSTARKVLQALGDNGLVTKSDGKRYVAAHPQSREHYPEEQTITVSEQVEIYFMQWMLRDDAQPGTPINELELGRKFGVATTIVREFLNRFQRYGLTEKLPNAGWVFKGFTPNFALELFEIRELFELRSVRILAGLPETAPVWQQLRMLKAAHLDLLTDIDRRFRDFSALDSQFHRLICTVAPNRFIDSFHDVITLIFHYHYQWNKRDERVRNEAAIHEHLQIIDALFSRDVKRIEATCRMHLTSARETLLRSILR